jgi:regulator of sigma E protease
MPKSKVLFNRNFRALIWVVILALAVYLILRNISVFGNVLIVLLGFGAVVLVHEFGHFIVAKLSGIKVEAFSIFMPPIFLGVRRTSEGYRFRILPWLFPKENDESGDGLLSFTLGRATQKVGETEYRIGLIPFGGFVKMLGQDDTGPVKAIDDPRSFANKPVSIRIPVIAAGVTFNVISACIIFMTVFLVGIELPPPVIGDVVPGSPAARAGFKPGDEIIEIAGKSKDLDFSNVLIAAALSDVKEVVPIKIRHEDGSEERLTLVAEQLPGSSIRDFGIVQPLSLTVAKVSDANALRELTGLLPGDKIKSVNGEQVQTYWQFEQILQSTYAPEATLVVERHQNKGTTKLIETKIQLNLDYAKKVKVDSESDLCHVYSMVPRLRITAVVDNLDIAEQKQTSPLSKLKGLFTRSIEKESEVDTVPKLKSGDIILAVDDIENPTYKEMRDITKEYEDKKLLVRVLREAGDGNEHILDIDVTPRRPSDSDRVMIGIAVALDAEHPVVAKTISGVTGLSQPNIPRGATITAIQGQAVSDFYDVIQQLHQHRGQNVQIDHRLEDGTTGRAILDTNVAQEPIAVRPIAEFIPFASLERLYRATGPVRAVAMGYRKTVMFITQTYVTLKRLIDGIISPKELMGPVGIIAFSYHIVAEQPMVYYVYFLGLISASIAVINFLPVPPFDGGLVVLLLIEKVKGSALNERTQGVIAYTGWILIGTLLLYVTFNDIVRNFFSSA